MYNKSWLDVNKTRAYPFRLSLPGIPNGWIADMTIAVHNEMALPLHVSKITIASGGFSLLILDKSDTFVGVFVYHGLETIKLSPAGNGCNGALTVDVKNIDSGIADAAQQILETHVDIELKIISFYKRGKIRALKIKRFREDDSVISGDIILEESDFLELDITKTIDQDIIVINSKQSFYPKCEQKTPIQKINNVAPNNNGDIFIDINHDGLSARKISQDILEIGSRFDIADFNKYALAGPRGVSGDPGLQGGEGPQGELICQSYLVDEYGGVRYDGIGLHAIYLPAKYVATHPSGKILACSDNKSYLLNSDPVAIVNFANCRGVVSVKDKFVVASNFMSIYIDLDGIETGTENMPLSNNIVALSKYDNNSNWFFAASENDLYINKEDGYHHLYHSSDPIRNISYANNKVYMLYDNGTMRSYLLVAPFNMSYFDFGISDTLRGMYDQWIIADNGKIIKFTGNAFGSTVIKLDNLNFTAIDGLNSSHIFVVSGNGIIYKYDGASWGLIGAPPIKNWKSVSALNESEIYIFG